MQANPTRRRSYGSGSLRQAPTPAAHNMGLCLARAWAQAQAPLGASALARHPRRAEHRTQAEARLRELMGQTTINRATGERLTVAAGRPPLPARTPSASERKHIHDARTSSPRSGTHLGPFFGERTLDPDPRPRTSPTSSTVLGGQGAGGQDDP